MGSEALLEVYIQVCMLRGYDFSFAVQGLWVANLESAETPKMAVQIACGIHVSIVYTPSIPL